MEAGALTREQEECVDALQALVDASGMFGCVPPVRLWLPLAHVPALSCAWLTHAVGHTAQDQDSQRDDHPANELAGRELEWLEPSDVVGDDDGSEGSRARAALKWVVGVVGVLPLRHSAAAVATCADRGACATQPTHRRHVAALEEHHSTCVGIMDAASEALQTLRDLESKHTEVSARAHNLHDRCNRLAAEQVRCVWQRQWR